jgi:alanyl aminopeptidase
VRAALLLLALVACARTPGPRPAVVPMGRLPADVHPTRYALDLTVDPSRDRFLGEARIAIELARPRRVIWLHGRELDVHEAAVELPDGTSVPAVWDQADPEGVVALRVDHPVGPGPATLRFRWDAAFDPYRLGLYRIHVGDDAYAFSQFEPILARRAFPSFDEPGFKTPFDVTLTVPAELGAITNTQAVETTPVAHGMKRVRFAPTQKLPTYLLAFAVGPLDVVDGAPIAASDVRARPVPLRGVTTRGRGSELAYALAETAPYVAALEAYYGVPYPYDKLDLIAVPDVTFGGMENAGAIVFRDTAILLDASASEDRQRGFAYIMAHELAHQWFGDLVTLDWWDDIWLNEAFATWMGTRIVDRLHPEYAAPTGLLESVIGAMDRDSLVAVRRIRQPIESLHDIPNAFDAITYSKGAGVLAMFERWIGAETFRKGIRTYLDEHRFGSATADDLLRALSATAEKDVAGPFRSFLDQPGVPLVELRPICGRGAPPRVAVRQTRYLPVGSTGHADARWQIPVCMRYGAAGEARERCALVAGTTGTIVLDGEPCPEWIAPNADGAGYYRWTLPAADFDRLRVAGWPRLAPDERLSVADAIGAAFAAGTMPAGPALDALEPLARDPTRAVAVAPMSLVRFVRDQLAGDDLRPRAEAFARRLYAPALARLGWTPRTDEDGETRLLRARVLGFLADVGQDPAVRREAAARGRKLVGKIGDGVLDTDAVAGELVDVVLAVAVQDGDAAFFAGVLRERAASTDTLTRARLLTALGATHDPALAAHARDLALDPTLHLDEIERPLWRQTADVETRAATWDWLRAHFDALEARLSRRRVGDTPWMAGGFCDESRAAEVDAFFAPRIRDLAGGPRNLAGALESIRLCAARVEAQRESARVFLLSPNPMLHRVGIPMRSP